MTEPKREVWVVENSIGAIKRAEISKHFAESACFPDEGERLARYIPADSAPSQSEATGDRVGRVNKLVGQLEDIINRDGTFGEMRTLLLGALVAAEASGAKGGYDLAKAGTDPSLPKAPVGDGWVRCSERMPDPDVPLDEEAWSLVYAPARGRDMASWDGERWIWRSHGYAIPSEVTHWRPLPPPPAPEGE